MARVLKLLPLIPHDKPEHDVNMSDQSRLWDEDHVKALLRLLRCPENILYEKPWSTWIEQHGGIKAVRHFLRTCNTSESNLKMLNMILDNPYTSAQTLADKLWLARSTYFIHLQSLILELSEQLNSWIIADQRKNAATSTVEGYNNLPVQMTSLIGCERIVGTVYSLLRSPEVHLLTLTGPGGVGKTRVGIEVASELVDFFADGVFFIPLAAINAADFVVDAIAQTLDIKKVKDEPILETLCHYFQNREALLLLDNFEHVLPAAPLIATLLRSAAKLKVLVTSRAVLSLYGEHEFAVPPLALPAVKHLPPIDRLKHYGAIRLFVERAQVARNEFVLTKENAHAVSEICTRLDGLPLAIELAAVQMRILSPQAIVIRLQELKLMPSGIQDLPARQQTIRGAIDWSYVLLNDKEKNLFTRLAVFVNGYTIEAAENVVGPGEQPSAETPDHVSSGDLLATWQGVSSLLSKSLLRQEIKGEDEPRFSMLETIHEYALDKLKSSGQEDILRRRHALYYLKLVEKAKPELTGDQQHIWLKRLEADQDNLRLALGWALERSKEDKDILSLALRFGIALWMFWLMRGDLNEGRRWLESVLALIDPLSPVDPVLRAAALGATGILALEQGDYTPAKRLLEESLSLRRDLGDKRAIANTLTTLGTMAAKQGDCPNAEVFYIESLNLRREIGDKWGIGSTLGNLGAMWVEQGDAERAKPLIEESLLTFRALGDKVQIAVSLNNLGEVLLLKGEFNRAKPLLEESLQLRREMENRQIFSPLLNLGDVAWFEGDLKQARSLYEESLLLCQEFGSKPQIARCFERLAELADREGAGEQAMRLFAAAETLRAGASIPFAERARHEKALTTARNHLDDEVFRLAWAQGSVIPPEDIIENILGAWRPRFV